MIDGFLFVYMQLGFVIESEFVYCETGTEVLCNMQNFVLLVLNSISVLCNACRCFT